MSATDNQLVEATFGERVPDAGAIERANLCRRLDALAGAHTSLSAALRVLRRREPDAPPDATLRRWYGAWKSGGAHQLADRRAGRRRKTYGWEARAIELWSDPARPARATVAYWLRDEGWADATNTRVRRFIQSLPATVGGEDAPKRAGRHWHRQNVTPHVVRDAGVLDVGLIYEGDGHLCKVYVQHPASGRHWRPELTAWICARSHFVAGWWLSEAESAISTLQGLSRTLVRHDHVPAALHTDPGSGFRNRLMEDECVGWLTRTGIDVIGTLPGNPRGQGLIEGWWRWFEERCGKRFATYCGACRTDRALSNLEGRIAKGEIRVPTLAEYADAVATYVESYNSTPQDGLGAAPETLWRDLVRNPVELPEAVLMRPAEQRIVHRGGVTLFTRLYRAPELRMIEEGTEVTVEYDVTDASRVTVIWKGRKICEATRVAARDWASPSRVADLRKKREAGRLKRLERLAAEVRAQARPVIDGARAAQAAAEIAPPDETPALPSSGDYDPNDALP